MSSDPLSYAPPPPVHRRTVFRRSVAAVVVLAILVSSCWWGPTASRRVRLLYWQRRCLSYSPPPDQKVYAIEGHVQIVPEEWLEFYALWSPPGLKSMGTVFLHELKNPRGERLLVALDLNQSAVPGMMDLDPRAITPGTLYREPAQSLSGGSIRVPQPIWISAGSIDPADPTHFTIQMCDDSGTVTYDGWLQNDDSVSFGRRKAPTTSK